MARFWTERFHPRKHRNPMSEVDVKNAPAHLPTLLPREVYFVEVCSFTFEFHSIAQIEACLAFYSRKLLPSSRMNPAGADHWECQRWFERLPLFLREEPKRLKVVKALQKVVMLVAKTSNNPVNRTPKSFAFGFPPLRSGAGYFYR